ncbi:MAG TPA: DoxX family protein [Terriglobia bacterium]|nr:DoxX family protein [Terriglobia bacterium]
MKRYLGRYSEQIYGILRIVAGFLFACHGAQKLLGWPGGAPHVSSPLILTAGVIELLGGLMIAIGLVTSFVAFIASGEMAVAYFIAHAPGGLLPIVNRGELAVLYCFIFLYMASRGSGAFSLDGLTGKR